MARRKVSISVYLDRDQADELRARSARTGEPYAAIIRRAIDRELRPSPISQLDVLAKVAPEFFAQLSPTERVVLSHMWGLP